MDPFNSQANRQARPDRPERPDVAPAGNDAKKRLLQQLMQNVMGAPAKGIHDTVHAIKTAMGAYKNFSKEWDAISGGLAGAAKSVGEAVPKMPVLPIPGSPTFGQVGQAAQQAGEQIGKIPALPIPGSPNLGQVGQAAMQAGRSMMPPVAPKINPVLPPAPVAPQPPQMPQMPQMPQQQQHHDMIAPPMPSFMGGGKPAGF